MAGFKPLGFNPLSGAPLGKAVLLTSTSASAVFAAQNPTITSGGSVLPALATMTFSAFRRRFWLGVRMFIWTPSLWRSQPTSLRLQLVNLYCLILRLSQFRAMRRRSTQVKRFRQTLGIYCSRHTRLRLAYQPRWT